jgi:hypothetical protein
VEKQQFERQQVVKEQEERRQEERRQGERQHVVKQKACIVDLAVLGNHLSTIDIDCKNML